MNIEFAVFARIATRCGEIVEEPGAPEVLVTVYQGACAQPLARYLAAMTEVDDATTRVNNAESGLTRLLEEMDQQFRIARSAVGAMLPDTKLPAPLRSQTTDTDKRKAIERLIDLITPHAGQPWADTLLQGKFGQTAAVAIPQLNESVEAQNALQKAKADRSGAFDEGWSAYMRFKRLVRNTLGSTSRQYRRIHVRAASGIEEEETPGPVDAGSASPFSASAPGAA